MANDAIANLHVRMIGDTASFQKSSRAAAVEAGRLHAALQTGSKGASRLGVAVQSAGYQVNDFVVQTMAGQNVLVAFAQQASQFAGVFGPAGAVAGAGIAIGSVVAQLLLTRDAAKDARIEIRSLGDEMKTFFELRNDARFEALGLFGKKEDLERQLQENKDRVRELFDYTNEEEMRRRRNSLARERVSLISDDPRAVEIEKQIELIDRNMGNSEQNLATIYSLYSEQQKLMNRIKDITADIDEVEKDRLETLKKTADARRDEMESYFGSWRREMEKPLPELKGGNWDEQIAANKKLAESYLQMILPAAEKTALEIDKVQDLVYSEDLTQEQADRIVEFLQKGGKQAADFSKTFSQMWDMVSDRAGQAFADMVLTGENAFKTLSDIVAKSVLEIVARMAIINPILNGIFGSQPGFSLLPAFFGKGAAATAAPGKATGGNVAAGQPYRWQEMGREYFVPDTGGKVVKSEASSGPTFNMNYTFTGGVTPQDLARILPEVVKQTKRAVYDANQRWQPA